MSKDFKTGAWVGKVECPSCRGKSHFAFFFKKFGEHRLVACTVCCAVFVDGDRAETIETIDAPQA